VVLVFEVFVAAVAGMAVMTGETVVVVVVIEEVAVGYAD